MKRAGASGDARVRETPAALRPLVPALISGALLAAALPPFPSSLLPFVALVPLSWAVAGGRGGRAGAGDAARSGYVSGVVFFLLLLHWIMFSVPGKLGLGVAAWGLGAAGLAVFPALAVWATHRAVHRVGVPLWLALPATWTATEWLRGHLPGGLAFPWAPLALGLTDFPRALSFAPVSGELGVTFWLVLVNGLLAEALVLAGRAPTALGSAARTRAGVRPRALAFAVSAALIATAPWLLPAGPRVGDASPLEVALVQTSVSAEERAAPDRAVESTRAAVDRLLAQLAPGRVQLIVLPETSFLIRLEDEEGAETLEWARLRAARARTPMLVGALGVGGATPPSGARVPLAVGEGDEAAAERRRPVFNSIFLVDAAGLRSRYDKQRPVPGAERAPILPDRWLAAVGGTGFYALGSSLENGPLPLGAGFAAYAQLSAAVLICWESAFAGVARAQAVRGARVLVNATNDAWFAGPLASAGRAQHEAHLVLRVLETGLPAVRAANGGAALVVSPDGEVRRLGRSTGEGLLVTSVPAARVPTPFLRTGDRVGPACLLACLLLLALSLGGRTVEQAPSEP